MIEDKRWLEVSNFIAFVVLERCVLDEWINHKWDEGRHFGYFDGELFISVAEFNAWLVESQKALLAHELREIAINTVYPQLPQKTDLYRHFDKEGELLYVGISLSTGNRTKGHRLDSGWWDDISRIEIEKFESRGMAEAAEVKAIQSEKPKHNVRHRSELNE